VSDNPSRDGKADKPDGQRKRKSCSDVVSKSGGAGPIVPEGAPAPVHRRNDDLVATPGPLRVFLDDDFEHRHPRGNDWIHVGTAKEAIALLETGRVVALSLDHDLGSEEAGTGIDVVVHLERRLHQDGVDLWPTELIEVHSGNVVGAQNIARAIAANTRLVRVPAAKPRWEAR
jgi:hypothetical protein